MTELVKYDAMVKAIEVAYRVDEVTKIRKAALALKAAAKIAQNEELERKCAAIRIRAERKAGQLLHDMAETGERAGRGRQMSSASDISPNLPNIGISRNQSSQWQRLADVPQRNFDSHVRRVERGEANPTTAAFIHEQEQEQGRRRRGSGGGGRRRSGIRVVSAPEPETYGSSSDDDIQCGVLTSALKRAIPHLKSLQDVDPESIAELQQAFEKAQSAFKEGLRNRRRSGVRVIDGGRQ